MIEGNHLQSETSGSAISIQFRVECNPVAQKRHRHTTVGKFVRVYDPSAKDKAALVKLCMPYAPASPFEGPLKVDLDFWIPRPKSHYGTGKNSHVLKEQHSDGYHTQKPDIDNLRKLVMDALNGVFWVDDSQICQGRTIKRWYAMPEGAIDISVEKL